MKRDLLLSLSSTLFLLCFLTPPIVYSTCVCCVLGYGWKRLDFDTYLESLEGPVALDNIFIVGLGMWI
jgi:hypothetical protein